jgi:hypothetical protein
VEILIPYIYCIKIIKIVRAGVEGIARKAFPGFGLDPVGMREFIVRVGESLEFTIEASCFVSLDKQAGA